MDLVMHTIHVGLGERGRRLLAALHRSEFFVPVAVVDPEPDARAAARALSDLSDAECFETLTEAIYESDAEAVVLATPAWEHRDLLLEALAADLHVLAAPPLTSTLEDAGRCVYIAQNRGVKLMVAMSARYSPAAFALRRAVESGGLGVLTGAELLLPEPCRVVSEKCVEAMDAALAVLGESPATVSGSETAAAVRLNGGLELRCRFGDGVNGPELRVSGTRATAIWKSGSVVIAGSDGSKTDLPLEEAQQTREYGEDVLQRQFHAWVRHGVEPETSGRKHLVVLELLEAIQRAAETGVPVSLSEKRL